jgi:glycosyltransferase involved in cell wall biosynthesis
MEVTMPGETNWLAIAWAPYSRRSEMFARELQGKLYCIHNLKFQSPIHAPLKYILQAFRTLVVLVKEQPDAIHVQNPPFVCGLVVYFYSLFSKAKFVFEHHSAVFNPVWDWALPIQKFLARHASTNIVTNQHWAELIRSWGGDAIVMYDPFLDLPQGSPFPVKPGFNVAFASTFAQDEPVEAVVQAAALLPEVNFYITGNTQKKPASIHASAPPNVVFTGFLDMNREYLGLLRAVDAVIVLTTRDFTLQLAGCEAAALGKPVITTDWPYLKDVFPKGAVFVPNSPEGIRDGILGVQKNYQLLKEEVLILRAESRGEWDARLRQLKRSVA